MWCCIAYLAVHSFLCNDDSYTGMMVHNYYLYEEKGKLSILPWDYNLAFGGFSSSQNATSTVNSPIDSPVTSGYAFIFLKRLFSYMILSARRTVSITAGSVLGS